MKITIILDKTNHIDDKKTYSVVVVVCVAPSIVVSPDDSMVVVSVTPRVITVSEVGWPTDNVVVNCTAVVVVVVVVAAAAAVTDGQSRAKSGLQIPISHCKSMKSGNISQT